MQVKSYPGTRCPKQGRPREYITDTKPVDVPDTAYYRRMVSDGSLMLVAEKQAAKKSEKGGSK
jgi:hypothetical protein